MHDRFQYQLDSNNQWQIACHTGYRSCFYRQVTDDGLEVIGQKVFDPDEVYKKKS